MFFYIRNKNNTIKYLRKSKGYTSKELANKTNISLSIILKVDNQKLKEIPEPLKTQLINFFTP